MELLKYGDISFYFSLCNQRETFKTEIIIRCWSSLVTGGKVLKPQTRNLVPRGHLPGLSTTSDTVFFSNLFYVFKMPALEPKMLYVMNICCAL